MRSVNVNLDYDMNDFEEKANKIIHEIQEEQTEAVKYCANVFANSASKHTPPNLGKTSIKKEMYQRPFLVLIRLVRGGYGGIRPTEEDRQQLKNGMVYKVLNTKGHKVKQNVTYAYCKSKGQLKELCRIENRGLAKVMWGKNLEKIGAKIPNGIKRLMKKSPNLQSLDFNKIDLQKDENTVAVEIENEAENIGKFGVTAKHKGYGSVKTGLKFFLQKIVDKEREI